MADEQNTAAEENASVKFSYVGEEELAYFLSLINRLGDAKYMPIDQLIEKAQSAIEANRLSKGVLINGQLFDGTQDITFDEYAKTVDVLNKRDCAAVGAEDNASKVVVLDTNGKVNSSFIDMEGIQQQLKLDAIDELQKSLDALTKSTTDEIDALKTDAENSQTDMQSVKNYVGMHQAKISVNEATLPASVTITDVEYTKYCTPPIEVLKNIGKTKTQSMDYIEQGYSSEVFDNCKVTANSINVTYKPVPVESLLIQDKAVDVNLDNYQENPNAWINEVAMPIDGVTNYIALSRSFNPTELSKTASLSLFQPKSTYRYGVVVDSSRFYCVKDGALELVYTSSNVFGDHADTNELIAAVKGIKSGDANALITLDMISKAESEATDVRIALCSDGATNATPVDIAIQDVPKNGYILEASRPLSVSVGQIKSITPNMTVNKSVIRFGIKRTDESGNYTYSVWDVNHGTWKDVPLKEDISSEGADINELLTIPEKDLNVDNANYSFVFAFQLEGKDSECQLGQIEMTYVSAFSVEKALHGTDYSYAYSKQGIYMQFMTAGDYLVNYSATDVLPQFEHKVTVLTPKKVEAPAA